MEQPLGAIWVPYPAQGHDMSTTGVWNQNTKLLISRWQLSLLTEPKAQLLIHTLVAMGWINFGFGYSVGFSIDNMSKYLFCPTNVLKPRDIQLTEQWYKTEKSRKTWHLSSFNQFIIKSYFMHDLSILSAVVQMCSIPSDLMCLCPPAGFWPLLCGSCSFVCVAVCVCVCVYLRHHCAVCVWVGVFSTVLQCVCDVFGAAGRFGRRPCDPVRTAEAGHNRGPAVARRWVYSQQVRWEGFIIFHTIL